MTLYEKIKYDNANESAELNLGMVLPHEYQCPNIDYLLRNIGDIQKTLDIGLKYGDEDSLTEAIENASYDLESIPDSLEELRNSIIEIRAWGEDWKAIAKLLINSLPEQQVLDTLGYELKEETILVQPKLF